MQVSFLITRCFSPWMSSGKFYHIFNTAMSKTSSDLFLIERLQSGDKDALYTLYDKYAAALFGVIVRMCRNKDLAEDLLQECFVKIWEKINTYDASKGRFYTWAYRIAKNTTLNHLRKSSPLIQSDDLSVYDSKQQEEPERNFDELNGILNKLEPHHRAAIELVYFRGYTHREAHKEMEVPLGTFKSYVRQALFRLRELHSELLTLLIGIEVLING